MMKNVVLHPFSRSQGPREERASKWRKNTKLVAFLSLLVLLMMATSATGAGLACAQDSECRRNVCIAKACAPRPLTGGKCDSNSHCFNSATESCIDAKCVTRSLTAGPCDDTDDCASTGSECESKQCSIPFDPSVLVWEGNKGPQNYADRYTSVAVGGILYTFEGSTFLSSVKVEAYDPSTNTWTSKTSLDVAGNNFAVVAVGVNVFLVGGVYLGSARKTVCSYDATNDAWDKTWDQLPEGRYDIALAAVDDTLFVFGGSSNSDEFTDTIFTLDVTHNSNTWTVESAVLPDKTARFSAVATGTDIYITGGNIAPIGEPSDTVLKYDSTPAGRSSNPSSSGLSTMLKQRSSHTSFLEPDFNRLYVVGGIEDDFDKHVEYLDLNNPSGSWVSASATSTLQFSSLSGGLIDYRFYFASSQSLFVLDVRIYFSIQWAPFPHMPVQNTKIFQLIDSNTIIALETFNSLVTSFYNIAKDSWSIADPSYNFPVFADNAASVVINGEVFVMGGVATVDAINAVYSLKIGGTWEGRDFMPAKRTQGCAAASGTDIYFYGGATSPNHVPNNNLFKMDTTKASGIQWTEINPVGSSPTAVMNCAAVVVNGKLLIFGGTTDEYDMKPTGLVQSFDIASKKWDAPLSASIAPRRGPSAVIFKGFVFVIGGDADDGSGKSLSTVEIFDPKAKTVKTFTDMPSPRYSLGSVTDGTSIFCFGGKTYSNSFPSLEVLRVPSP